MISRRRHEAAIETVEAACDVTVASERRLAAQGWNLYDKTLTGLNIALARVQELEDRQNAALDMLTNAKADGATVIGIAQIVALLGGAK